MQNSNGTLLVLCEGNHCRSPMVEGLLRAALRPELRVASAGLGAQPGFGPHPIAVDLMAGRGIDITAIRSCQATPEMILAADLILVMDQNQKEWCEAIAPSARGRVYLLGCWLPPERQEIPDPMGKDRAAFLLALDLIVEAVGSWLPRLNSPRSVS